jgi:hypothetical protein
MIALFLLLAGTAPTSVPQESCVRAIGSEFKICGTPPAQQQQQQQVTYRLPNVRPNTYGRVPGAQVDLGDGVRASLSGQASNSRRGRRNKSAATLSVPF